jgi:pyrimidine deaminase RibD-like protein
MDDQLRQKIDKYVGSAYNAALHESNQAAALRIASAKAQLAQRGILLSGGAVHEIAKIQGEHVNTVVQAKADALLDAYELYGAEIDDAILEEVRRTRALLVGNPIVPGNSGLPPRAPGLPMFPQFIEASTGSIINRISCQIEQRKAVPKFKKGDVDRAFEQLAIDEARLSSAEDERPHPRVGAVVVKNGTVVSRAHRGESAKCHAEFIALEGKLADDLVSGATVYTTLEPCTTRNHPKIPCAQRLIERKVRRVVIGILDPNPDIRGLGIQALNDAGIETQLFPIDLRTQIEEMNRDFVRVQKERQSRGAATSLAPPMARLEPEVNLKMTEILKHKGQLITVFTRQKYGYGYLEGYWPNGGRVVDCTPLWVAIEDPIAKTQQSFSLTNVEVLVHFATNRPQLTVYR